MQLVSAGAELTFEVTFDAQGLDVAMTVLDTTPSLPVVVSGPTAMDNPIGNTYIGKFTPESGKSYLIFKAVYSDNTFSAFDPDHSQSSETIFAGTLGGGQAVDLVGEVSDAEAIYATVDDDDALEGNIADMDEII